MLRYYSQKKFTVKAYFLFLYRRQFDLPLLVLNTFLDLFYSRIKAAIVIIISISIIIIIILPFGSCQAKVCL